MTNLAYSASKLWASARLGHWGATACVALLGGTQQQQSLSALTSPSECVRRSHTSSSSQQPAGTIVQDVLPSGTGAGATLHLRAVPAGRLIWLPMPKLSHQMTHGRIAKWHVGDGAGGVGDAGSHSPPGSGQGGSGGPQPGPRPSRVSEYDILLTVDTDSLVEEAYRLDQFAGTVSLLVESQEEAHVAALLAAEGEEVEVGRPIAVLCEDPGDAAAVRAELLLRQPQPLEAAQTRPSSTAASGASAAQPLAPVPAAALAMHGSKGSKHASAGVGTEKGAARLSEAGRALMASVGNLYADLDAATGSAAGLVRTAPPPRLLEWQSYLADSSKSSSSSKCGCM